MCPYMVIRDALDLWEGVESRVMSIYGNRGRPGPMGGSRIEGYMSIYGNRGRPPWDLDILHELGVGVEC
jgi:hypothetical protein